MNKIVITGRLAAAAETRFMPNGDPITNFRVGSDVGFGDKKTTNWFACSLFGKRGEALAPHLGKAQQVTVFGQLTLREWVNKSNEKQISADIRVDEIELQGSKPQGQSEPATQQSQAARQSRPAPSKPSPAPANFDGFEDDVPFVLNMNDGYVGEVSLDRVARRSNRAR